MPELPEVETIAEGLNRVIKGRKIVDVWCDWPKYFKMPKTEIGFKKCVIGRTFKKASRRAKYLFIDLSDDHLLAVHQKMTGHLLYGKWNRGSENISGKRAANSWDGEKWLPDAPKNSPLWDPMNRFIRLIFFLDNGKMLALSDARRFSKVLCGPKNQVLSHEHLERLGPEPLDKGFTFEKFKELFENKKGRAKQVLMDPAFIVGIGNIYADEILYLAKVHPLSRVEKLKENTLKKIFDSIKKVLTKAVKLKGTSIDDYRMPTGKKGSYGKELLVYHKHGKLCPKGHTVERIKLAARSAHFCPVEQKLYK